MSELIKACDEKGILTHCKWKCKLLQPLWEIVQSFLKKLEIELPCDPAIPLPDITKKNKHIDSQRYEPPSVHNSTIYNCQDVEAT